MTSTRPCWRGHVVQGNYGGGRHDAAAPCRSGRVRANQGRRRPQRAGQDHTQIRTEDTALTITRTSVDIKPDMCIWRGTVDGTDAPATIMWWPASRWPEGFSTRAAFIQSGACAGECARLRLWLWARIACRRSTRQCRRTCAPKIRSLHNDPLVQQGDASMLRPKTYAIESHAQNRTARLPAKAPSKDIIIDIIVAYTKKAASNYADVRHELVALSIEEANRSFRISNLGHIKLRLVHAYQTNYVEEGEHVNHLWRFADKGDGYMEEIHAFARRRYRADVAMLIVDDPIGCGLATRVFADAGRGIRRCTSRVRCHDVLHSARARAHHRRTP